jgi:hypothetical protein
VVMCGPNSWVSNSQADTHLDTDTNIIKRFRNKCLRTNNSSQSPKPVAWSK